MAVSQVMTAPGFLLLDYERIISQWGEGSVFACEGDALGELLLHLDDDDDCDTSALIDCMDECTGAPRAAIRGGNLDLPAAVAAPRRLPEASSSLPARQTIPARRDSTSAPSSSAVAAAAPQQWQQPKMQMFDAPQLGWWECAPGTMGMRDDAKPAFPMTTFSMQMQHSNARQASCEAPCVVPDNSMSAAQTTGPQYGLVPQLPPPTTYICAAPMAGTMLSAALTHDHASDLIKLRQACLKRYRDKKARRMYTKMVRYQLRKINADKRPRIKGRFVKKTQEELAAAAGASAIEGPAASREGSDSLNIDDGVMSDISS